MTVAEAIDRIQKILDYMESLDADEEELKDIEALRMTIRSFEAWEKIRVKIENVTPKAKFQTGKTNVDVQMMIPQVKVLQIIDKHLKGVTE